MGPKELIQLLHTTTTVCKDMELAFWPMPTLLPAVPPLWGLSLNDPALLTSFKSLYTDWNGREKEGWEDGCRVFNWN